MGLGVKPFGPAGAIAVGRGKPRADGFGQRSLARRQIALAGIGRGALVADHDGHGDAVRHLFRVPDAALDILERLVPSHLEPPVVIGHVGIEAGLEVRQILGPRRGGQHTEAQEGNAGFHPSRSPVRRAISLPNASVW